MSTTLTLDEAKRLYPKFYQSPHLWTDAIEVEVNEDFEMDGLEFMVMNSYDLSRFFLTDLLEKNKLDYFIPLFKPQEGEQFIKDLEAAVSAGIGFPVQYDKTMQVTSVMCFEGSSGYCFVSNDNISQAMAFNAKDEATFFDTAAYVDHLRKLGYYL